MWTRFSKAGAKTILLHKESLSGIDFSIIYNTLQKDPCNSEKEAVVYIYTAAARFGAAR